MLIKFRDMAIERDEEFAKCHKLIVDGLEQSKPSNWQAQKEISEEEAREAIKLMAEKKEEVKKAQVGFKDLIEEVYYRIISEK